MSVLGETATSPAPTIQNLLKGLGVSVATSSRDAISRDATLVAAASGDDVVRPPALVGGSGSARDLFSDDFYLEAIEEPGSLAHYQFAQSFGLFDSPRSSQPK